VLKSLEKHFALAHSWHMNRKNAWLSSMLHGNFENINSFLPPNHITGREIKFCIVAESGAAVGALADSGKKRSIHDRLHRVSGNPIQKRRRAMVVKKRVSGGAPKVGAAKAGKAGRKGL
jgi:hypothetical protein